MTCRELLELAALAAGYAVVGHYEHGLKIECHKGGAASVGFVKWCPHLDDGDALRLAIDARVSIEFADDEDDAPIAIAGDRYIQVQECLAPDFKAKTRRAIVRAAAEIGKAMQ